MDKIEVYNEFLKSLRVAMTNSSVYFKEHPLLIGSIENLKKNVEKSLTVLEPLRIGIASNYLLLGDVRLENKRLYNEIIDFFHRRKIKIIEIRKGVSVDELLTFLTEVNLPYRDILRGGGLENILKERGVSHIVVESLDYSQLLKGEGEEFKDVWLYLLGQGLKAEDAEQIKELTADFEKVAARFDAKDLLDDAEKEAVVGKLLDYLKDKDQDKLHECTKDLAKSILKTKFLTKGADTDKLKQYFTNLSGDDVGDILIEQLESGEAQKPLNFELFSTLIDAEKHKKTASSLAGKLKKEDLKNKPQLAIKMKELFSLPETPYISKVYQDNLSSIVEGISLGEGISFDRDHLQNNYSLILLELFSYEQDEKRLALVLDSIFVELNNAIKNKNIEYIRDFIEILDKKRKELPSLEPIFRTADATLFSFIENAVLRQSQIAGLGYLLEKINKSSLEPADYLDVIFNENRANPAILRLFFKFFPQQLDLFYEKLDRRISDIALLEKIIGNLKEVESTLSLYVLKHIFSVANDFLKIEVLKAMETLSFYDKGFLFPLLKSKDFYQRKHAFLGLSKHPQSRAAAAKELLIIPNPLGLRTRLIEENLKIAGETRFKEVKEYLYQLSRYKFFWNKTIRTKAKRIIARYES